MVSSDFRKEARDKMSGKWGKAALITFVYGAVTGIISFIQGKLPTNIQGIFSLIVLVIELPLSFGLLLSLFNLYNGKETSSFEFLSLGFSNFGKSWGIALRTALKMILPIILLIVSIIIIVVGMVLSLGQNASLLANSSTIDLNAVSSLSGVTMFGFILYLVSIIWLVVKSYTYQLAYIVAADNETLSSKECVEKSATLMSGNRFKLFCLQLSFIGWAILCAFTFGIGFLWLAPYIQFAIFAFYYFLAGNKNDVVVENTENN